MSEAVQDTPSHPITPDGEATATVSPPPGSPAGKPPETLEQKYMRETRDAARGTRNAVTFIAWVVGVLVILGLIGVIITAVQLAKLNNNLNNGGGGGVVNSNCMSVGGTDPSC